MILLLSLVGAILLSTSTVFATDRHVPGQYPTIQAAINAAVDGDTVIVAQDTYYENINFGGKSITVTSTDPNDPNVIAGTVIDANGSGTVVTFPDVESANCVLAGFTITDGNASDRGGGILCWDGSITIDNCIITGNSASKGGGIYSDYAELTVAGCTFSGNVVDCLGISFCGGGGIFNQYGNLIVTDCTFTENVAVMGNGGGIYSMEGELTLTDCTFTGNSATFEGGGVATDYNSVIVTNCTFSGNSAQYGGGMNNAHWGATATNCIFTGNSAQRGAGVCTFYLYGGGQTLRLSNCTFSGNTANDYGGAVCNQAVCNLILTNCIAWGNIATEGPQVAIALEWWDGTVSISYSCVQGGQWDIYTGVGGTLNWLTGNIDSEPRFADEGSGDYHLKSTAGRWDANTNAWVTDDVTSPCIDAGNPSCPLGDEPNDSSNIRINMGAYGGTAEASKSPANWASLADLTNDHKVNFNDLAAFAAYWLDGGYCIPGDLDRNEVVNLLDLNLFANEWLWEQ